MDDMAPSGYVPYTQDGIAFATAYSGVWLYKVRLYVSHGICSELGTMTLGFVVASGQV